MCTHLVRAQGQDPDDLRMLLTTALQRSTVGRRLLWIKTNPVSSPHTASKAQPSTAITSVGCAQRLSAYGSLHLSSAIMHGDAADHLRSVMGCGAGSQRDMQKHQ